MRTESIWNWAIRGFSDRPDRAREILPPPRGVVLGQRRPISDPTTVRTFRWLAVLGKMTDLPEVALVIARSGLYVILKESDDPVDSPVACAPRQAWPVAELPPAALAPPAAPRIRFGRLQAVRSEPLPRGQTRGITFSTPRPRLKTYEQYT